MTVRGSVFNIDFTGEFKGDISIATKSKREKGTAHFAAKKGQK
jgi:hypothetical protein